MPEFILQTRITPPKVTGIVHRSRLNKQLDENIHKSLILLCTPSGYGKTTSIQDYLSEKKLQHSWLNVTGDMDNLFTFMSYLSASLQKLDNNFGRNTIQIIESLRLKESAHSIKEECETIMGTFINEFCANFQKDIVIVIDDLHNIDFEKNTEWLNESINFLFENIPDNLHVIIISREYPLFRLARLTAKRKLYEMRMDELSFSEDEAWELLKSMYSFNPTSESVAFLTENSGGWITGIHLILNAYGSDFYKAKMHEMKIPEDIFNFFAQEIFTGLGNDIQNFLINTALPDNFSDKMSDWLLNIKNSKKIIEELVSKNIFIQHIQAPYYLETGTAYEDYYSYHALFHSFLLAKVHELKTGNEINEMLMKIAGYYYNANEIIPYIDYSIKAGNFKNAISNLTEKAPGLFSEGQFMIIWNWLKAIPDEIISDEPNLLYYKGKMLRVIYGNLEESLLYLNRSARIFEKKNDLQNYIEVVNYKADTMLMQGKTEDSFRELQGLLNYDSSNENKARLYHNIARVYYNSGQYDESLEFLNKSIEQCTSGSLQIMKDDNLIMLGSIYLIRGEFIKSSYYNEQIAASTKDPYRKFRSISVMIFLKSYSGNYNEAKEYLDYSKEMLKKFPLPHYELALSYQEAKLRNVAGDYEGSITAAEEAISTANKINRSHYLYFCYILQVENFYYLNKIQTALEYLELSRKYADKNNKENTETYKLYKVILEKKIEKSAEKILLDSLEYYISNNLLSETVQLNFHLADYYFRAGEIKKTIAHLEDSLKTAYENEYISIFENKVFGFRDLLELAIAENKYRDFIEKIIKRALQRKEIKWLSDESRKRLTAETENFYNISVITFGTLAFKMEGEAIPEEKWKRKISKVILAYLLVNPGLKINKDRLIDIFFTDMTMEKAEPLLHNAITNMRNALKRADSKKQYISYENKMLSLNENYYYKSDAVEFNNLYSLIFSPESNDEQKKEYTSRAMDLYKGEFLAGYDYSWINEMRDDFLNKYTVLFSLEKKTG